MVYSDRSSSGLRVGVGALPSSQATTIKKTKCPACKLLSEHKLTQRAATPAHAACIERSSCPDIIYIYRKALLVKMKRAQANQSIYFSVFTSQIARESISEDIHVESKLFLGGMPQNPPRWRILPVLPLLIAPPLLQTLDPPLVLTGTGTSQLYVVSHNLPAWLCRFVDYTNQRITIIVHHQSPASSQGV